MTDRELRRRAWSSAEAAGAYERTRPGYPRSAVRWVMAGAAHRPRRVLDLGAGTGKLTRTLLEVGVDVVAVDPASGMLEVLAAGLPSVERHVGTAEEIPLPDGSVDAVVCGQAWHWVEPTRAVPEVARVLRPGGVLGLLWNLRDERVGWVAALSAAMENHEDAVGVIARRETPPHLAGYLEGPELRVFAHAHALAPGDLRELTLSRSHVLTRDRLDRERVLSQVAELARTHPDLAGKDVVELPYRTVVWRARTHR